MPSIRLFRRRFPCSAGLPCLLAAGIAAMSIATAATAHEAHVHGVGKLDVALDNRTLSLHLDSPLINLLGFEHAAASAPDRLAVQKMRAQLHAADKVFATTPAAQCRAASVTLASAALDPALPGQKPAAANNVKRPAGNPAERDGHADLDADFVFDCTHPELLRAVDVKLFEIYPGFRRIDVQAVTPKGQSAAALTPGAAVLPL